MILTKMKVQTLLENWSDNSKLGDLIFSLPVTSQNSMREYNSHSYSVT